MKKRSALLLLPAFLFAFSAGALAGEQEDFNAVYADWQKDRDVTACHFSQQQLENARRLAEGSPDFEYAPGFGEEVDREIARWRANGCAGVSPAIDRAKSPLRGLKITAVSGRGGPKREYVKIRNTTGKRVSLKGATLRGRTGKRAKFPSRTRFAARRTYVVRVGCGRSRRTTVYLCRKSQLFRDNGDTARIADAKGVFVSQRGFGAFANAIRY